MGRIPSLVAGAIALTAALAAAPARAQSGAPQDPRDDAAAALRRMVEEQAALIRQLLERIEKLERERGGGTPPSAPQEPAVPAVEIPGEPGAAEQPAAPPPPRASRLPDISVIGNHSGRFVSVTGDADRNRFQLGEFEIGLQQPVYPGIRFDAFLAAGADEDFALSVEEAYASISNPGGVRGLGAVLGRTRLGLGRINPVHPHARLYVDQPAVLAAFLGEEALTGNGASLTYLLPLRGLFASLELGLHDVGEGDVSRPGLGAWRSLRHGRLWLSSALGRGTEVELGASHAFDRDANGDDISLTGLDLTYRTFPSAFKRLLVQGEAFWHRRKDRVGGSGCHTRFGHYALLGYRPDQYWDYALRLDNTRLPWPLAGREQSLSFILTNRLNEATLLRLQYKHGDRTHGFALPAKRGFNELYLQLVWGAGSHTHALQ